jgi:acetyltransferase-like isoleucine patch superfamily enzyme
MSEGSRIGRNSTIQIDCLIAGIGMAELRIGNNVGIAYRANILLGSHDLDYSTESYWLLH